MSAATPRESVRAGKGRFVAIVQWEILYYLRRVSTWLYVGIFFALGFLTMLLAGGMWPGADFVVAAGGKVKANSPYSLAVMTSFISLLGISVTAALAGNSVYRDYEANIHPLFFTTPVPRREFLGGRFAGALLVNALVLSGIAVGLLFGSVVPGLDPEKVTAVNLGWYAAPLLTVVLPNVLFLGAIFFALAAVTRQMLPNYVGGVLLLVGYLLSASLLSDLENKRLGALFDPFGLRALTYTTQYWTIVEKNTRTVPLSGVLLANRALWSLVGLAIFAIAYQRFRFAHLPGGRTRSIRAEDEHRIETAERPMAPEPLVRTFDLTTHRAQFLSITRRSFWGIVRDKYFYAIVGGGLLFLTVTAQQVGKLYGTTTWPVTYEMEEMLSGTFGIFIIAMIAFYSGELIWAERDNRSNQIIDSAPVPTAILYLAKLLALCGVLALLMVVVMVAGIVTQSVKGYHRYEIGLYLQALFGFRLVDMILLAVAAMAIHAVANHKYVGHLLVILLLIGIGFLPQLGLEHNLYRYTSDSGSEYSDMNGWGPYAYPFVIWKIYWSGFAILLGVLTILAWVRGQETRPEWRLHLAKARWRRGLRTATGAGALLAVGTGSFIFYNTNVLNHFRTGRQQRKTVAEYERRYKKFEHVPQPRVVSASVRFDLWPEKRDLYAVGNFALRNETNASIDTVHIRVSRSAEIRALDLGRPAEHIVADSARGYHMYRLRTPLAPGDSLTLHFDLAWVTRGFPNSYDDLSIAGNGTFVEHPSLLPGIGYSARNELDEDDDRKKEKLPARARMAPPTDTLARRNNYVSSDADWIRFDATACTASDQIAVIPGYLQREWTEKGRRCFAYAMDAPILNIYALQSARYAVKHEVWRAPAGAAPDSIVNLEIYYQPGHEYNLARMFRAMREALNYCTTNFGPFQHRQLRILEFPRYAQFAQSLPNTIPYSEAIGFIARIQKPDDIDYSTYVTAHEVAHQWWAHQLIGGDVQGSTMLSETLAQYSALMVMEREYGVAHMRRFLEYELDRYLLGRSTERKKEMPLVLVEDQPYIHYRKGSLVMYQPRNAIGEAKVNQVLSSFLAATKYSRPPYPTARMLVDSFRAATPDSLKYLITDLFETITLYEVRTDSAVVTKAPGGWSVDLSVTARKLRADSLGSETEIPIEHEWMDVGVFSDSGMTRGAKDGTPLYLAPHQIRSGTQHIQVMVTKKPDRAGIDPLHRLVDRITNDNVVAVRQREGSPK